MAQLQDPTAQDFSQQDDEQSEEPAGQFFSPQVRYANSNVTCSNCEYFDSSTSTCSNQKKIADSGPEAEPGARCEEFDPANDGDDDEHDGLKQSIAQSKPFGEGASGYGVSNS